jgi:hypothetical protein
VSVYRTLVEADHVLDPVHTQHLSSPLGTELDEEISMADLRFLLSVGAVFTDEFLVYAAQNGRYDILSLALSRGVSFPSDLPEYAARDGQWMTVIWAARQPIVFNYQVYDTRDRERKDREGFDRRPRDN